MLTLWITIYAGAPVAAAQDVGEVFGDCDECHEMIVVPDSRFIMGSARRRRAGFLIRRGIVGSCGLSRAAGAREP